MIRITLLLIIIFILSSVTVASADVYLPIATSPEVQSSAISYGKPVALETGYWIEATCIDGQQPTIVLENDAVLVFCEEP